MDVVTPGSLTTRALVDYRPSQLRYRWGSNAGAYRHNFARDLQGIAVWQAARHATDELIEEISASLNILQVYEIVWSAEHVASNFNRIYGHDPSDPSSRHEKVGSGPFLYIIAADEDADYVVWKNISGKVELTNRKIALLKPRLRSRVETADFRYNVHSSNSLAEFMRDAVLILGLERFREQLQAGFPGRETQVRLEQDMAGASGWCDLAELFGVMRYACNAVVLRGYEEFADLSAASDVDEIDLLCDDLPTFSGTTCSTATSHDPSKSAFMTMVGGRRVKLDARSVGDGYYDARWQQRMLDSAEWDPVGIPVLEPANYVFSLLYHAKIQKPAVKPLYRRVLPERGYDIGLPPALASDITTDEVAARLLRGFLIANGYRISLPIDQGVHHNTSFSKRLKDLRDRGQPNGRAARPRRTLRRRAAAIPWLRSTYRAIRRALLRK